MSNLKTRLLRDDFFLDKDLAKQPGDVKTLLLGLRAYSDKNGNFMWDAETIQAAVLPFVHRTNRRFSTEKALEWLQTNNYIERYEVDGRLFGHCVNWECRIHGQRPHKNESIRHPPHPMASQRPAKGAPKANQRPALNNTNSNSNNNNNNKHKLGLEVGDLKSSVEVLDFDNFWTAYKDACQKHSEPSSPGDKQRAHAYFKKTMARDPDLHYVLPVALKNLITHKTHYGEKYQHASTWLNTEWWMPYFKEWEAPKEKKEADPLEGLDEWEPAI
jgi:hypothetical protein